MAFDLSPDAAAGPPPAAIVAPAPSAAEPIPVDSHGYHYVVTGNTLLPAATVKAAVESGATPKEALDALNRAYQSAGYFLTAIGGEVNNKLVAFRVIHGKLTETDAVPELAPYFAGLERRDDLDRNTLIRRTSMAEAYSARQGMRPRVNFSPAKEVGGSKITVIEEPIEGAKPWSAGLSFGNLGSRFSSKYTASASGAVRPGGGLELTANYLTGVPGLTDASGGSQYQSAGTGFSVVTPWGVYGATWSQIAYRIGESAAPLYPNGNIGIGTIIGTQLLQADETRRVALTETFTHVDNLVTVFDEGNRPEGLLTDQRYGVLSAALSLSQSFAILGRNANLGASATLSQGISPRGGTFVPVTVGVPDPRFTMIQATLNYSQSLPAGYTLALALSGQYADDTVPQNQQWVIGGLGNLTAWLPAILVGDSGSLGRLSVTTPPFMWDRVSLSGNAFIEGGVVRLHHRPLNNPTTRALGDAGFSLTGTVAGGTSLVLAYAWPVAYRNVDREAINAQGRASVYFSLSQSF